jgi:hypothetical protein
MLCKNTAIAKDWNMDSTDCKSAEQVVCRFLNFGAETGILNPNTKGRQPDRNSGVNTSAAC